MRSREEGQTLITVLISLVLVAAGYWYYSKAVAENHGAVVKSQETLVASSFASEGAELFRSLTNTQLNNYLFNNAAKFAAGPIPLCAHINILDRTSGQILNRDPLADLPATNRLNRSTAATQNANRYYQVQIVEGTTLAVDPAACGRVTPYNFAANPTKRFRVTVNVTWLPKGGGVDQVQRAVVSTLLPEI
jgi:hypothetical protein